MQRICEIWPTDSQLDQYRLQICVRRPSYWSPCLNLLLFPRPIDHTGRLPVLTAAQDTALQLYYTLRQALRRYNLDKELQSLGNGSGLKYLPATEVKHLGLQDLGYQEHILLIRQEYITAFESLHLGSRTSGEPSVIVIGQPGIGGCYLRIVDTLY
jgi:hypothetical protein